jgi:hypothetical protein
MANAVRNFYEVLEARLELKRFQKVTLSQSPKTKCTRNLSDRDAA